MDITIENANNILRKYLSNNENKLKHSMRVANISKLLAKKWNVPVDDAVIAALLHDIGKSLTKKEMLNMCVQNNLTMYDFEIFETAEALHGKVSSLLFEKEFDKEKEPERFASISHAISYHVAGGEDNMSMLDKVIYVADNVDPIKDETMLKQIQLGKFTDINECIKLIIEKKKELLLESKEFIILL